jgi:hypothetical protein
MSFLYVIEQGAHIKKKGPRIQVVKDEEILADRAIKEITTFVFTKCEQEVSIKGIGKKVEQVEYIIL